jgi:hypothetical protein
VLSTHVDLSIKLQKAVSSLNPMGVKILLDQKASPHLLINDTTALHLAVRNRESLEDQKKALKIIELLLENRPDVNQLVNHRTFMNLAAHNSFWAAVGLIASKIKTDTKDSGQYGSALIDVVRFCKDEEQAQLLVDLLLEAGAIDNRHSQSNGYTSLHWAIENNRTFILRQLLYKFPGEYLRMGGTDTTPARMAFDQNKWECVVAIAEVAYLPIIKGERSNNLPELANEKDIIFKYVCSLPSEMKWQAILNGQNKSHPLGALNYIKRDEFEPSIEHGTLKLYHDEELKMRGMGYPALLTRSSVPQIPRSAAVPIKGRRQSAPGHTSRSQVMHNYLDRGGAKSDDEVGNAYSPLFEFEPVTTTSLAPPAPQPHHSTSPLEFIGRLFQPAPPHETSDEASKVISRFNS